MHASAVTFLRRAGAAVGRHGEVALLVAVVTVGRVRACGWGAAEGAAGGLPRTGAGSQRRGEHRGQLTLTDTQRHSESSLQSSS